MITIRPQYNKWRVLFSAPGTGWRGFSILVTRASAMHAAIDHYHGRQHKAKGCPLCQRKDGES